MSSGERADLSSSRQVDPLHKFNFTLTGVSFGVIIAGYNGVFIRNSCWRLTDQEVVMPYGSISKREQDRLAAYKNANADLLRQVPGFAEWLSNDYIPIAGAWQY